MQFAVAPPRFFPPRFRPLTSTKGGHTLSSEEIIIPIIRKIKRAPPKLRLVVADLNALDIGNRKLKVRIANLSISYEVCDAL